MELTVKTSKSSYKILIQNGLFQQLGEHIRQETGNNTAFIITDDTVNGIYGTQLRTMLEGIPHTIMVLPSGEKTKSLAHLAELYSALAKAGITRHDCIVAFGGGVIGDISGFAAATYLRGIKLLQVPTTLLAQVDSSVGGKVAVNLPEGKNLVGSFYPPNKVLIDPLLLQSLPKRIFNDGMAEVIKYGCIRDRALFDTLADKEIDTVLEQVICRCVEIKKDIVEQDEFDTGERMLLNFGHTFGHVVESLYHYETYTHGEGVAIGMLKITEKTEKLGMTKPGTYDTIKAVLKKYDLLFEDVAIDKTQAEEILFLDKKSSSKTIHYVILEEIGKAKVLPLDKSQPFLLDD